MYLTQSKKLTSLLCFILSLSAWSAANAQTSSLNVRGFGTLGVASSSSADVEFVRDLSQPYGIKDGKWSGRTDTVLGVQVNWQLNQQLEVVGQVVSRYQYDTSRAPVLDLAFLKWVPEDRMSLRLGRIGADVMMLSDSRLVGYSYLTVRPSVDFFGPVFFSSFDGVDASLTLPFGEGLVRSKLLAGVIQEKASGGPGIWDTSGSSIYGAVVDYFVGYWQFRVSSHSVRLSNNLNFASLTQPLYTAAQLSGITMASLAADALTAKDTDSRYHSLGLVYDNGPLQVQAAANKIINQTAAIQNSKAAYVLAGYRLNTLTPYIGISRWKSRYKDYVTGLPDIPEFAPLNQAYQMVMEATGAHQTTYTMGVRWDVGSTVALKFQWDAIRGNEASKFPYAKALAAPSWNGRTDVVSATLDFVF